MIKLVCKECGKVWYTANTSANQKCDECGGLLDNSKIVVKKVCINNN